MGDYPIERREERAPEGALKPERVQKRPAPAAETLEPERVQPEGRPGERRPDAREHDEPAADRGAGAPAT